MLEASGTDLTIGQAQSDTLLRGSSQLTATLAFGPQRLRLIAADLANGQIKASIAASPNGQAGDLILSAQLGNLGLILPQFPGPVTLAGTARTTAGGTGLDVTVQGPAQMKASVAGTLARHKFGCPCQRSNRAKVAGRGFAL